MKMDDEATSVCVLGAGVIGLASAINIQNLSKLKGIKMHVTLISENFSPNTTGDGSGGFWEPHLCGETPLENIRKWGASTFAHLVCLAQSEDAAKTGSSLITGTSIHIDTNKDPFWKDMVIDFHHMSERDVNNLRKSTGLSIKEATRHTTVGVDCSLYLPWLLNKFLKQGGSIKQLKIHALQELAGMYEVIVNCTGLGSYDLLPDKDVVPVRGQTVKVDAPWIKHFSQIVEESDDIELIYIIPKASYLLLGGTHETGSFDLTPCPKQRRRIFEGCCKLEPSLRGARIIGDWVGLRPTRKNVRLEIEKMNTNTGQIYIVHNYGHGGSGVTFHWGCGQAAADLVIQCLQQKCTQSKL